MFGSPEQDNILLGSGRPVAGIIRSIARVVLPIVQDFDKLALERRKLSKPRFGGSRTRTFIPGRSTKLNDSVVFN